MSTNRSQPGDLIGKYRILAHIATGGMGSVYKAMDENLNRLVALKILSPELLLHPHLIERFHREARNAAKLVHRNIVTLYDYDKDLRCLVMEFVEGVDLANYIRRRSKLEPEEARKIIYQAAKALAHAHSHGIVHRDIKPSNFLLAREADRTIVKLTDLGLAKAINEEDFRVTRDGTTVGTVDYMAPEQARDAGTADIRSDLYSLGCTFYHMLAGEPPFAEGGLGERVYRHMAVAPKDVRSYNSEVTASLWFILKRLLEKSPIDRYQTPQELLNDLKYPPEVEDPYRGPSQNSTPKQSKQSKQSNQSQYSKDPDEMLLADVDSLTNPSLPVSQPVSRRRTGLADTSPRHTSAASSPVKPSQDSAKDPPQTTSYSVNALGLTTEQLQAAAGQFERAEELLKEQGPGEYALQLLMSCCKIDPTNLRYRRTLREVATVVGPGGGKTKRGWFSIAGQSDRSKFRAARNAGEHRKVLELGEELVLHSANDVGIAVDMADSATALGLNSLAIWLLDQARSIDEGTTILKALARVYERLQLWSQALGVWEEIRKVDPKDLEAPGKWNEIAVRDTLARGQFKKGHG